MKIPRFSKIAKFRFHRTSTPSQQKIHARLRAAATTQAPSYDEDSSQTRLSSALAVVAVLHLVAVAGIYAFNEIKSTQPRKERSASSSEKPIKTSIFTPVENAPRVAVSVPATSGAGLGVHAANAGNELNATVVSTLTKAVEAREVKSSVKTYTIKSGDRLVFIAKRFGVTQEELLSSNNIKDATKLKIGQVIRIPAAKAR